MLETREAVVQRAMAKVPWGPETYPESQPLTCTTWPGGSRFGNSVK